MASGVLGLGSGQAASLNSDLNRKVKNCRKKINCRANRKKN
ncbi:MAG: hypothetical protein R2837_07170 [Aliarcobacter sp.]